MLRRSATLFALLFCACPGNTTPQPSDTGGTPPGPDACVAHCSGRNCGANGCGGTCGSCTGTDTCDEGSGECVCTPTCGTKVCGDNGCGGVCGHCQAATACSGQGTCVSCTPACGGKVCGLDVNGCSCGVCTGGASCSAAGACVMPVFPDAGPGGADGNNVGAPDASPANPPDGGPRTADGGHVVTPGTWSDYLAFLANALPALCNKLAQCGELDSAKVSDCVSSDMASATASSNTKDSIESGARTFDSTAAAQCQAVLGTMTCDQLQDVLSGVGLCSSVTVPSALPGARCYNPYDCVGGNLYCTGPDCSQVCSDHYGSVPPGQVCDTIHPCDETLGSCHWIYPADGGIVAGTCVAYLAVGQSCWGTSGAECGTSSYCDDQGTCRARLDVGAACEQYRYQCKTGLYCAPLPGDAGYSGTCAAQVGSGSACFAWDACANGLNCNMTAHLCMPWFPTAGQPCTLDNSCYPYPPGLYCKGAVGTTPGVCSMATKVGSGQACATADPKDKVCTPGLRCDLQSATCLALLGNGQGPCTDNSDCKMLESCVKQVTDAGYAPTGTCQYAVTAGNGCPGLVDCLGPSFCDSATQTCVAPQPDGHACTGDSECANGNCFSNVCVAACVVP